MPFAADVRVTLQCASRLYGFPPTSSEQKCSQLQQYHQASHACVVVKSPGTTRRVARIHLALLALPSSFSSLPLITSRHPSSSSSSSASIRFSPLPLPHFWMPIDQCAKLADGRAGRQPTPTRMQAGPDARFCDVWRITSSLHLLLR